MVGERSATFKRLLQTTCSGRRSAATRSPSSLRPMTWVCERLQASFQYYIKYFPSKESSNKPPNKEVIYIIWNIIETLLILLTGSFFWAGELMPCYQHFSRQKYTKISHVLGGYIYPSSRGLRWSLQGLRWLHDDRRQSYIVLISLILSHDHRTMVAANRTISRGRSQIVADYHTMVVRWSCNNRRLAYDLDSKMLRSLKTCRKAIVVCDCSYDCGKITATAHDHCWS